jgi:hypothetical protein
MPNMWLILTVAAIVVQCFAVWELGDSVTDYFYRRKRRAGQHSLWVVSKYYLRAGTVDCIGVACLLAITLIQVYRPDVAAEQFLRLVVVLTIGYRMIERRRLRMQLDEEEEEQNGGMPH